MTEPSFQPPPSLAVKAPVPHPAWPAFVHPHRFAEARAALKKDRDGLFQAKGSTWGETVLHWAALGDMGLVLDLIAQGFDLNAHDRLGRTPLDWTTDRLWVATSHPEHALPFEAAWRVRVKTEKDVARLWGLGARPGTSVNTLCAPLVWTQTGSWGLLPVWEHAEHAAGLDLWRGWGPDRVSALHAAVLAPEGSERTRWFQRLMVQGLSVDEPDAQGRTPLWHACATWVQRPSWAARSQDAVLWLRAQGADPDRADAHGIAPSQVALCLGAPAEVAQAQAQALGVLDP